MTELRVGPHTVRRGAVVEVWEKAELIACIYSTDGGVKIVSKYLDGGRPDLVVVDPGLPPALLVRIR